jgi:hypothetical protein
VSESLQLFFDVLADFFSTLVGAGTLGLLSPADFFFPRDIEFEK